MMVFMASSNGLCIITFVICFRKSTVMGLSIMILIYLPPFAYHYIKEGGNFKKIKCTNYDHLLSR